MADEIGITTRTPEQCFEGGAVTIAEIKLENDYVGIRWMLQLFMIPMPDNLRADLVSVLRKHADALERHELDHNMEKHLHMLQDQIAQKGPPA